jgi:AraC-like DNA-binding protein
VHPGLRGLVAGTVGYREEGTDRVVRRQPAGSLIPLVVSFGPRLEILELSHGTGVGLRDSFVVGLMPGWATTAFVGSQHCLQVYLTPLGASRLLDAPAASFARMVVDLTDVIPALDEGFRERLWSAGTWERRFEMMDRALLQRVAHSEAVEPMAAWMWHQIQRSRGTVRISALVGETGMSHRHVTSRFRQTIGTTPKVAASVVRFEGATTALHRDSIADVAAAYGYADQSHLTREFLRFSGETPAQLRLARRPTAHTALGVGEGHHPAGPPRVTGSQRPSAQ